MTPILVRNLSLLVIQIGYPVYSAILRRWGKGRGVLDNVDIRAPICLHNQPWSAHPISAQQLAGPMVFRDEIVGSYAVFSHLSLLSFFDLMVMGLRVNSPKLPSS